MNQSFRRAAVGIPGFCAFFNLYGPQSLLPSLAQEFNASPAQISLTMTAATLAIAISAPFSGAIADVLGRKRVIAAAMIFATIPLIMIALASNLHALIVWRQDGLAVSGRQMLAHLRNPQLLATYAVGFGTLFTFVALFTYVNFLLAAPPFNLSPTLLGAIFVTYLAGAAAVLGLGRAIARFGRRPLVVGAIALWACGALLTLVPALPAIIAGLAVAACGGFIVQATSTGYVALTAESGRTSAIGFYATTYYVGGSIGAVLPGLTWSAGGWQACVAMVLAMQAFMAAVILLAWKR